MREYVEALLSASHQQAKLLYAGGCVKCRLLSAAVVAASLGTIERVPLERPQWEVLYDEIAPSARGYPVLLESGRMIWGPAVFLRTPLVAVRSALQLLLRMRRHER